jgi:hypothetical protein
MRTFNLGLTVLALCTLAGAAHADDFRCAGTVDAITVDNVVVPDGRTCTLNGTRVDGNIIVGTRSRLSASAVKVEGNVQAEGATSVFLNPGSVIDGSVQLKQGGTARIDRVVIGSDLQLESNRGLLTVLRNKVDGNVQVVQNTGGVTLTRNQVLQTLSCKQNAPAPTGSGNIAGDKEGQCARL